MAKNTVHKNAGGDVLLLECDEAEQLFSQLNEDEKLAIIDLIKSLLSGR